MAPDQRRRIILSDIDPAAMRGLEIGPLNNPIIRRSDGEVLYVDFADTETVKARPYDASINPADIVDVDVVWAQQPLGQAVGEPVDYIVASHVIEHVPDLVGWLHDLAGALKPGGTLSLVVPDKRFTFDLNRHSSSLGEVVEAYLLGYRRPSIRQVVDNCFEGVVVDASDAWDRDMTRTPLPKIVGGGLALQLAYDQAQALTREPAYIDSHCWVFTPQSLLALFDTLAQLKLLPFTVTAFTATVRGQFEFYVQLKPHDAAATDEIRASIARFVAPEFSHAERRLAANEASQSWRITAPLRALRRRLTGR